MKVFIDTNILIDFIARRDQFYYPAVACYPLVGERLYMHQTMLTISRRAGQF